MSEHNVKLIAAPILARIPKVRSEEDGLAILRDLIIGLARNSADHAFWKTKTESGWTPQHAARLSERVVEGNTNIIVETVHQGGGTLEMALDLSEVWLSTYNARLKELYASPSEGGRA